MPNSCQTHTFQGFSPVLHFRDNMVHAIYQVPIDSVLIMETEHFIF